MDKEKVYVYLARRDKKEVKIVSTMKGSVPPTQITTVKQMGLSPELTEEIDQIIYDNRMLWETWVQSAANFNALKANLVKRGYSNLPSHAVGMHFGTRHKKKAVKTPVKKLKTMLRRHPKS